MSEQMQVGELVFQLHRKAIKNLHINVLPPDGFVRVSAPQAMTETAIRTAVISRLPWIRRQQQAFAAQPRQPEREMVSGESHFLWGRKYRLDVVEQMGRHQVRLQSNNRLQLLVQPGTRLENRQELLRRFYRDELKQQLDNLVGPWCDRLGVQMPILGVKKMKTMWGCCNTQSSRIWINLELAKKPHACLEYILVHELVHLLERHHNERFKSLMDTWLPDWRERRNLLNNQPLAFEEWVY